MDWLIAAAVTGTIVSTVAIAAGTWKLVRFLAKVNDLYPVVLEMAAEFRTNEGSSLKDQMNKLEVLANQGIEVATAAKQAAETAMEMMRATRRR